MVSLNWKKSIRQSGLKGEDIKTDKLDMGLTKKSIDHHTSRL